MKPDVQLELLESAAEQLGVRVSYEALQTAQANGLRGGICKMKGANGMEWRVIIDKRATAEERVMTLATSLSRFDTSALALPAAIRETLRLHAGKRPVAA